MPQTPSPRESGRGLVLPTSEASHVHQLPMVKAYADTMGGVEGLTQVVPTAMAIDPGTLVLGRLLDPLRGRSPLDRLAACFACQDMALLLGQAVAPGACAEDTVGRG